ncbi:MAG: 2-octaprenyl-6-methoxyphenyl hydroxylase [Gammaproteobacteria bacterium]|jgi:2-octaprenyl-6-methoxyphenol hydroxylase|nr:2-octaprenyl-6-methoxyphenyl hydroxylase [Gammaproteobacteria bacterium]
MRLPTIAGVCPDFDVLIAGSGMVGASLACALAGGPLRIGVVEPVEPSAPAQPSYDDRVVALSLGSRRILEGIGVWEALRAAATPIRAVHVSDRGHFGATRLRADRAGVEALGYVVEARALGQALLARLGLAPGIERICPARVASLVPGDRAVGVALASPGRPASSGGADPAVPRVGEGSDRQRPVPGSPGLLQTLASRLIVAADGGQSVVREAAGIAVEEREYRQSAVIANLTPQRPHEGVAYERFTPSGPMAVLPMSEGRCALVWTVPLAAEQEVLGLDDDAFLAAVQSRFGDRLGRFLRVGARSAYPLTLRRARDHAAGRVVVIGNAAHTLHPVAGQGFNLGLRDVAALAQVLADAARTGEDPGAGTVLDRYAAWRTADQSEVSTFTDAMVRVFSNDSTLLALVRNAGLLALDLLPGLKSGFARHAMGLAGRQPRLARGLPL